MMILLIALLVLVVGVVVAVVVGKVGTDPMSDPNRTSAFELPAGPLGVRGLDGVRFDQALRGYNMAQVDAVMDKLRDELRAAEERAGADRR